MNRPLFDPDVRVQYWQPQELTFPLYVQLRTAYLPQAKREELAAVLARNPTGFVLVDRYDARPPVQVRLFNPDPTAPKVWVYWSLVCVELVVLPN
jgi:hypothetical protein